MPDDNSILTDTQIVDAIEAALRHWFVQGLTITVSSSSIAKAMSDLLDRRIPRDQYNKTHRRADDPVEDLLKERET